MPDEFWDHNAIDCAELMAATRCREQPDGTMVSVGEKFDGKRRNLSKRRVWGCLVVAKKYPTKVAGKLDDRGVMGVNLGRSRKRPGYNIWTPEYGVFTSKHVVFYETEFPFKDGTFALQRRSTGGGATAEGGGGGFIAPTAQPTAEDDESDDSDETESDDDEDDDDDGDGSGDDSAGAQVSAAQYAQGAVNRALDDSDASSDEEDDEVQSGSGAGGGDKYDDEANLLDDMDVGDGSSAKISTTNSSDDREHSGSVTGRESRESRTADERAVGPVRCGDVRGGPTGPGGTPGDAAEGAGGARGR